MPGAERGAEDGRDRREPRAAGNEQHRTRVSFAKIGDPQWAGNLDPSADPELRGDVGAGAAAGHVPDVEGEPAPPRRACPPGMARQAGRGRAPGRESTRLKSSHQNNPFSVLFFEKKKQK